MFIAILTLGTMAFVSGVLLGFAAVRCHVEGDPIVDQVDAVLPQTQCGQCSFTGCRAYAEAIVASQADINQCPPGGQSGVLALAELLGREPKPLDPEHEAAQFPMVAVIDEAQCIGCTLCIQACPVDAIVGAAKQMHTVIAADCTGCKLCVAPCPVDCIRMVPIKERVSTWQWPMPVEALRFS